MHGNGNQQVPSFQAEMTPLLAHLVEAQALESSDNSARREDGQIRQRHAP
jgi:hypothetical protein